MCIIQSKPFQLFFQAFYTFYHIPQESITNTHVTDDVDNKKKDDEEDKIKVVFELDGEAVSSDQFPDAFDLEENEEVIVDVKIKDEAMFVYMYLYM